jgi:hypothetical protein
MGQGKFREFGVVRVVKLIAADRHFDGSESVMRAPEVGDKGVIVYLHDENAAACIVECVDRDGMTVWLADFDFEELEAVD